MSLMESRLYCRDQVVGLEVWQELVNDDLFKHFRDERHVSDWSKVAWVSWVESLAFDDRDKDRPFLGWRQYSFHDGSIANKSNAMKSVQLVFSQSCVRRAM